MLDGVLPYSFVNGNHDYSPGKSPVNMNNYFPYSKYSAVSWFGGAYETGTLDNAWYTFKAGENNYIVLALEYGPTEDVITWAAGVIETHPDSNIIITTHAYLFRDGTTNIVLVISGHDPCDDVVITTQTGTNGNMVTQILCDPQGVDSAYGATGLVLLLHFSEGGSKITTEYYSTVRNEYFLGSNQTSFNLAVVNRKETETQAQTDTETTSDNTVTTVQDSTGETTRSDGNTNKTAGCNAVINGKIPFLFTVTLWGVAFSIYKTRHRKKDF